MAKLLEEILVQGLASARPAANAVVVGSYYFATDTLVLSQSTGSAWVDVGAPNVMTTAQDLTRGGAAGLPTRLAVGSNGNVLTVTGGAVGWAAPATSGTVTSVTGTSPIAVATGTTTPVVSIAAGTTGAAGSVRFATNAQNAASVAVQGNDARLPIWAKIGASQLVAVYGNGDPALLASIPVSVTGGTPNGQSGIGGVRAQMILFRLPYAFNPAHMWFWGRGTLAAALCFAIYPYGSGTTKTWDSGDIAVTNATWTDITAGSLSSVNLTANTDYWLCCSSTLASNTTTVCEVPTPGGAIAKWGTDGAPLGGGLGVGMPVTATIALTAGVFPGTLPTVAAAGTSFPPACWFTGTSS